MVLYFELPPLAGRMAEPHRLEGCEVANSVGVFGELSWLTGGMALNGDREAAGPRSVRLPTACQDSSQPQTYRVRALNARIHSTRGEPHHTLTSTPHNSTIMRSMDAALTEIASLKSGESPNYTNIANKYGVVRSTLTRRYQAVSQARAAQSSTRQKLNP
jgi:hypothetical protein